MSELNVNLSLLSEVAAINISKKIEGTPTENRVLIAIPKGETRTQSGLYVPSTVSEGVPRKGVIVKFGHFTEDYKSYADQLKIGSVVTYGLYAGKSISIPVEGMEDMSQDFTVLSLNEIIFIEPNNR